MSLEVMMPTGLLLETIINSSLFLKLSSIFLTIRAGFNGYGIPHYILYKNRSRFWFPLNPGFCESFSFGIDRIFSMSSKETTPTTPE